MNDVTLITKPRPAVRLERRLPDPPASVWRALTERDQLRTWFPCDVIVEGGRWTPGARISFPFPPEMNVTLEGAVLEVDEPNRLAFTWGEETLSFELSPDAGGTRLVLVDELPASHAARNAAGWAVCLDRLAGVTPEEDSWRPRFDRHVAEFEPIVGKQEGAPN